MNEKMEESNTASAVLTQFLNEEQNRLSKDNLQLVFFNYVYLGQWELARSSADLICSNSPSDRQTVLKALLDIAVNPYDQSLGSRSVTSPDVLSWLALQEYEKLAGTEQEIEVNTLKEEVNFRLLLTLECNDATPDILHDLYQFYQHSYGSQQLYFRLSTYENSEPVPTSISNYIKQLLVKRPIQGHHLICAFVRRKRAADIRICEALQGLYIQCVSSLLDRSGSAQDDPDMCRQVLQLLSFYNPDPYWNYLQIRQVFSRLVSISKMESSSFSMPKIFEALLGRSHGYLVDEMSKLLQETLLLGAGKKADLQIDLPCEEQRWTIHLLAGSDRNVCWQQYFAASLKWDKHFLGLILETCISLVLAEQFDTLKCLLEPRELRPLRPVVLLSCWTYCRSSASARRLLDTLWADPLSCQQPLLGASCNKLAYQLSLIKWCLERARPLLENSDSTPSPAAISDRGTRLMHGLETHSVLYVLHSSTRLASLDSQEVLHLLQNVAKDSPKAKAKNVRFEDSKQQEARRSVSIEQKHDICIYRSYCAVKNVMDAIVFCYENASLDLMNPISMRRTVRPRQLARAFSLEIISSSEGDESSAGGESSGDKYSDERKLQNGVASSSSYVTFQELYKRKVWQRIQQAREHLRHVFPLPYRVEVMENIFSLLFCRHSDIVDGVLTTDGDSEEENEGEESKAGSINNLSMSFISEDDPDSLEKFADNLPELESSVASLQQQTNCAANLISQEETSQGLDSLVLDKPLEQKLKQTVCSSLFNLKSQNISDGMLPLSKRSSAADYACGFLANEYVTRDILAMLRDALTDLSAAKFQLQGQAQEDDKMPALGKQGQARKPGGQSEASVLEKPKSVGRPHEEVEFDPSLEKVLAQTVCCSIQAEKLQKHIAQLTQHVHEAQWRFQLVVHEQLPKQPGVVLEKLVIVTDDDSQVLSILDDWITTKGSDDLPDGEHKQLRPKAVDKHSESKLKSVPGFLDCLYPEQQSIVNKMLATPESLLVMSLRRNNLVQATQVIKLMKLSEKMRETTEVAFAEIYSMTAKAISNLNFESGHGVSSGVRKFSMKALKSAAAAGVASGSLSDLVEDLLAHPNIPPLPRSQDASSNNANLKYFSVDPTIMVLIDLVCTSCSNWDLCNTVLDIIKAKRRQNSELVVRNDSSRPEENPNPSVSQSEKRKKSVSGLSGLKGVNAFLRQLESLLQLGYGGEAEKWSRTEIISTPSTATPSPVGGYLSGSPFTFLSASAPQTPPSSHQSLLWHLRNAVPPLTSLAVRQYEGTVVEIRQAFEQANQALAASSYLNRQESINIDEHHFAATPKTPGSLSPAQHSQSSSSGSSLSVGSKESGAGKLDAPILHVRMKQLITAMEKFIPFGGFYQLLMRHCNKRDRAQMRNYLLSMYEHVKELAYTVAECECKTTETLVLPKNYFSILQEGPVDILGRLMFVKRMPPGKLERVAHKLSLNLTHIIVQSCCPRIPSKHLPFTPVTSRPGIEVEGPRCIYNSVDVEIGVDLSALAKSDPERLVHETLNILISTMRDISAKCNGQGIFDELACKELLKSEAFEKVMARVKALQHVNLSQLSTWEMRLCFFANLLNLMTVHFHLETFRDVFAKEGQADSKKLLPRKLHGIVGDHLMDMVTLLGSFCYRVGDLDVLSLFDLKYLILARGQRLSHTWKSLSSSNSHKPSHDDPMAKHMPPSEPRLLFVISDGCLSSPPVTVLDPKRLSSQLEEATRAYLTHTVSVDLESHKVTLPFLLTSLHLDPPAESQQSTVKPYDNLLNFITIHAEPPLAEKLIKLMAVGTDDAKDKTNKDAPQYEINLTPFQSSFAYVFTMEHLSKDTLSTDCVNGSEQQLILHFPGAPTLSMVNVPLMSAASGQTRSTAHFMTESSSSQGDRPTSLAEPASYQLTPVTMDYVRETSVLVATLVTLLCSDELDDTDAQFSTDHLPSGFPRNRTSSDISVVDIRSYRYQRLVDDFPILLRHLLAYIIPLAGADNPEISQSSEPILKFVTNVIEDDVKLCLFSPHDSLQFLSMLQKMTTRLGRQHRWQSLVLVVQSIPEVVMAKYPHLQLLHDFVLSCWAREVIVKHKLLLPPHAPTSMGPESRVLHHLRKFYCFHTQARLALAVCDGLPVDYAMDLFDLILSQGIRGKLRSAVEAKRHCLTVYSRMTSSIKTHQIKLAMQASDAAVTRKTLPPSSKETHEMLNKYSDWRLVSKMSEEDPKEVMSVLIQVGDFSVARDWAKLYCLPGDMVLEIEVGYILFLLNAGTSELLAVYQTLEDLRRTMPEDCYQVCKALLERMQNHQRVKFLAGYMLQRLATLMSAAELEELRLLQIGAKALLCIPEVMRGEYSHLITCPHLILEQLLMNMKGDLAGRVFTEIQDDFTEISDSKLRLAQDQFNALLVNYARCSLEVTVVQTIPDGVRSSTHELSRPDSADSGSGSSRAEDADGITSPTQQRLFAESVKIRRSNMETALTPKQNSTPPGLSSSLSRRISFMSSPTTTTTATGTAALPSGSGKFIMPAVPPPEDQWVPDSAASLCMVCKLERFSMFNRRHHCRRCGRVVCGSCSTRRSQVRGVSSRTCDECFEQMLGPRESRARDEQEVYSQRMKESLSGVSPSLLSVGVSTSPRHLSVGATYVRSLSSAIHHTVHEWKLKPDEGFNSYIRDEFYYEQAPSVALCMSILNHHSDPDACGQLILTLCDELSSFLQPVAPGVPNLEVDYSLIISIIRDLLFRAKVIFLKNGSPGMLAQCDAYLTRVDLLKLLLQANYSDLPTLHELTKMDTARRLCDRLVLDERLPLALEVCTKCGVDATGVWLAWGRACLTSGDFSGARDKFSHCLKVPKDKNQIGSSSRQLMDIIDQLECLPPTGITEIQMLLEATSLGTLTSLPVPGQQEETTLPSLVYQECMYYLHTYGTFSDQLKFLVRNGCWIKALKFFVDHQCSSEVFVDSLLLPSLQGGEITHLLEQLLIQDPSLEQWMSHLAASCRYLLKNKRFHVLYNIQLFMKDYVRAAMNCYNYFYQLGTQSYLDLAARLQFLFIAQEHMQAYLDPQKWGAVRHPLSFSAATPNRSEDPSSAVHQQSFQLCLSRDEAARNLRTIALQIEVTQYLEKCLTSNLGEATAVATQYVASASSSGAVPTLFGSSEQRKDVVKMVLLSGGSKSLPESVDLALRIITEHKLLPIGILKKVVSELVKQAQLADMMELLKMTSQQKLLDDDEWDELVSTALLEITEKKLESKDEAETLIKLIKKEHNRINAFILSGRLRSAYLTAAKSNRTQDIIRIMAAAERMGQAAVRNICKKWLDQQQNLDADGGATRK